MQIYVQLFDNPSRAREALSMGKGSVFPSSDKTTLRSRRLIGGRGEEGEKKGEKGTAETGGAKERYG